MALDQTSDAIRHFIGLFVLWGEEGRLRSEFEAFERPEDDALPGPASTDATLAPPEGHAVAPYDPQHAMPATAPDWVARDLAPGDPMGPGAGGPAPDAAVPGAQGPAPQFPAPVQSTPAPASAPGLPEPPAPNAIATLTEQRNVLSDDDLLLAGADARFVDPAALTGALETLAAIAEGAGAVADVPAAAALDLDAVVALAAAFGAEPAAEAPGAADGAAARGQAVVDVRAVDALPEWSELMPAFFADDGDAAPDEGGAVAADAGLPPEVGTFGNGLDGARADPDPGQEIVTGANRAINETAIATRWIDAPVIAVGGDVARLDLISQSNALVEDTPAAGGSEAAASRVVNAAEIDVASASLAPAPGGEAGGAPVLSVVTRHEGDLVAVNDTTQVNFLSDTDRLEVQLGASNARFGLGENLAFNTQSLVELGYVYDFIAVSGDMLVANVVSQVNVLLDLDSLSGLGDGGAATADNLLLNRAEIAREGVDTVAPLDVTFAETLERLGAGDAALPDETLDHALFEGVPMVRTLFVDGDFTLVNRVEQQNVVGDADQVGGAIAAFVEEFGGAARITAGSNALVNAVALQELGIDSTVLAGGQSYSDALMHQAGLIEETPAGDDPAALANEAVAFLADGLVEPGLDLGGTASGPGVAEDGYGLSMDVMQTILA